MNTNLRFATRIVQSSIPQWGAISWHKELNQWDKQMLGRVRDTVKANIANKTAPTIIADNIAEYLVEVGDKGIVQPKDMVCLKLPYKGLFVEWLTPAKMLVEEPSASFGIGGIGTLSLCGCFMFESDRRIKSPLHNLNSILGSSNESFDKTIPIDKFPIALWCISLMQLYRNKQNFPSNSIVVDPQAFCIFTDEMGVPSPNVGMSMSVDVKTAAASEQHDWMRNLAKRSYVALYAVNALHCKNVVQQDAPPQFNPPDKWLRRQKTPKITYKTLKITGMRDIVKYPTPRTLDEQLAHSASMPVHSVRGHFKCYTEANKLMGKHVGIYWWHPQMRGKKEHGQVIKDYELLMPEEETPKPPEEGDPTDADGK